VFGLLGLAEALSRRHFAPEEATPFAVISLILFYALLGPLSLLAFYVVPIRLFAGKAARALETAGLASLPLVLGGCAMVAIALIFPIESPSLVAAGAGRGRR
jgi:hypothetical protein